MAVNTLTWIRNPKLCVREMVEVGYGRIAWDRGYLEKFHIDPYAFSNLYFARTIPWESLLIGPQGTAHIDADHPLSSPRAVYPTWSADEEFDLLVDMVENPWGENPHICGDPDVPVDERPVIGQPHLVVVTNLPMASTGLGRRLYQMIKELQDDNPACKIHIHGSYSYRMTYGYGFGSTDVEVRGLAAKGKVTLPSGKEVIKESLYDKHSNWVTMLGWKPKDMEVPRNRCMFNIKSALWAGEFYRELYNFPVRKSVAVVDTTTPKADYVPTETKSHMMVPRPPQAGDKQICDSCSLADGCKYYREGAVCSVPGAEPAPLAKMFGTRDAGQIIDGIGRILETQARRYERGLHWEAIEGELDPELTKIAGQLIDGGTKLAKLLDPSLQKPGVNVNVLPGGQAAVVQGNAKQLVSGIMREIEAAGMPRDQITQDMVKDVLKQMGEGVDQRTAIEGHVISRRDHS